MEVKQFGGVFVYDRAMQEHLSVFFLNQTILEQNTYNIWGRILWN